MSDNLKNLPADEKFDLIVSNPPHFDREPLTTLDPVELGNVDQDWLFHRDFYADVHRHLKPGGEVWFLENGDASDSTASSAELLLPFIRANPELEYVKSFTEKRDRRFFWMITRLRESAASPSSS